jgi:hypothetical protein
MHVRVMNHHEGEKEEKEQAVHTNPLKDVSTVSAAPFKK